MTSEDSTMKDAIFVMSAGARVVLAQVRSYGPRAPEGKGIWINFGAEGDLLDDHDCIAQLDEALRMWYGIPKAVASRKVKQAPLGAILDMYHRLLPELPRCEQLTATRQTLISARWLEHCADVDQDAGLARIEEFFMRVRRQPFLMGNGKRGWRASLTWLMKQENFAQTLEMAYAHKAP